MLVDAKKYKMIQAISLGKPGIIKPMTVVALSGFGEALR